MYEYVMHPFEVKDERRLKKDKYINKCAQKT
jgi:hypothetical protein